jgi:hypothetical protein
MSAGGLAPTRTTQTDHQRSVVRNGLKDGHCQILIANFPVANADVTLAHGLGRTPVGYHAIRVRHGGGIITDSANNGTDWTIALVVLSATVAGVYTIMLF